MMGEVTDKTKDAESTALGQETDNDVQVFSQWTPNPNAFKFIVSDFVINQGKATYETIEQAADVPLVRQLMALSAVTQIHLFENVITVTQDGSLDWGDLTDQVERVIKKYLKQHDANIVIASRKRVELTDPELQKIDAILERTIRPGLQGDGGDVEVIGLENNILTIRYQGACGTCPSSLAGTLNAITSFLREEYRPDMEVVAL